MSWSLKELGACWHVLDGRLEVLSVDRFLFRPWGFTSKSVNRCIYLDTGQNGHERSVSSIWGGTVLLWGPAAPLSSHSASCVPAHQRGCPVPQALWHTRLPCPEALTANKRNRSDLYQSRELPYGAVADKEQKAFFIINPKQQDFKNSKVRTTIPNNVLSKWMEDTADSTSTLRVGLSLKQDFQG